MGAESFWTVVLNVPRNKSSFEPVDVVLMLCKYFCPTIKTLWNALFPDVWNYLVMMYWVIIWQKNNLHHSYDPWIHSTIGSDITYIYIYTTYLFEVQFFLNQIDIHLCRPSSLVSGRSNQFSSLIITYVLPLSSIFCFIKKKWISGELNWTLEKFHSVHIQNYFDYS